MKLKLLLKEINGKYLYISNSKVFCVLFIKVHKKINCDGLSQNLKLTPSI